MTSERWNVSPPKAILIAPVMPMVAASPT